MNKNQNSDQTGYVAKGIMQPDIMNAIDAVIANETDPRKMEEKQIIVHPGYEIDEHFMSLGFQEKFVKEQKVMYRCRG